MFKRKYSRKNLVNKMLSVAQVSEKYGFHPQTVRNWINRDGLKHVKHGPGGKVFFKKFVIERFIKNWYSERSKNVY